MFTIPSFKRQVAGAVLVVAAAAAGPAHAVDIQTGSYSQSGIGAEFASPFDTFAIAGSAITIAMPTTPASVVLGTYSFEVGPNCWGCTLTPTFNALIDLTVDGITHQFDLPYTWYSSGPSDYLTVAAPAPVVFDFDSLGLITIAIDPIGVLSSSGSTVHGNVNAIVYATPVPEPGSYALMLGGLAAIGFIKRRRRI